MKKIQDLYRSLEFFLDLFIMVYVSRKKRMNYGK